jgi:DNA-binding LacI/PurR family transcriptional regulator
MDVARLAGVSRQTVSNVINGNPGYTPETKEQVEAAIAALGYQPNRAARSLRTRRTRQLAYHVPSEHLDPANPFMFEFLKTLIRASDDEGYHILVFTNGPDLEQSLEGLVSMGSADAFLLSNSAVDDPRARFLARRGIPFMCMGRLAPDLPPYWVDVDNVAGIADMVDYVVGRGRRDLTYVGYAGPQYWDRDREEGFKAGLRRNGMALRRGSIVRVRHETLHRTLWKVFNSPGNPPGAVITGNDIIAAAAVSIAAMCGLTPGKDVAITGFDCGSARFVEPRLTTVRVPMDVLASTLIRGCLDQLRGVPVVGKGTVFPTGLVIGDTA